MLDVKTAMSRLDKLRTASRTQRAYFENVWGMAFVYDHGKQWGYEYSLNDQTRLRFLKQIVDPRRSDIRVKINRIHQDVVTMCGKTTPDQISFSIKPKGIRHRSVQSTGATMLMRHLDSIKALEVLRDKEPARYVMGTSIVRRTLHKIGPQIQTVNGDILQGQAPGWSVTMPYEIIRDPASTSLRPALNEEIFCQCKAMPISWVNRNFGGVISNGKRVRLEDGDVPKMGELLSYQKRLEAATGTNLSKGCADSNTPAVLVYECYYQDEEEELPGGWPWVLYAIAGRGATNDDKSNLELLHFGSNPFFSLPFHFFHNDVRLLSPWGRGIPELQKDTQDVFNIGVSWLCRMMQEGSGKIVFQENTVEEPNRAFSNRIEIPIPWKRQTQYDVPPFRLAPPLMNPAVSEIMAQMPQYMRESINMEGILQGRPAGKRGESGDALNIRLEQASDTLEIIRRNDDLATNDLLFSTYVDLMGPSMRLDIAQKILGEDVPEQEILNLLRTNPLESVDKIEVDQVMNRPRTPGQMRNDYVNLATAQVMEPDDALWEMTLRGDDTKSSMYNAYNKQLLEIQMMINGESVIPVEGESHQYHRRAISNYIDQPAWLSLPQETRDMIEEHYSQHQQMEMMESSNQAMTMQSQMPQRGSPPAAAATLAAGAGLPEQPQLA